MQVKIDTKEKFHVISPIDSVLSATMADEIKQTLLHYIEVDIKNVVFDMNNVISLEIKIAEQLVHIQQNFYENNASFVVCCLNEPVISFLAEHELLDLLNVTPTQSEAADIVQMEEIERELLDDDALE